MATDINPGNNWQTVHNNNPSETLFIIKAGTHTGQQIIGPRAGITIQLEAGVNADGNGIAYCIDDNGGQRGNVSIIGPSTDPENDGSAPHIFNYHPPLDHAAIRGRSTGTSWNADGWTLRGFKMSDIGNGSTGGSAIKLGTNQLLEDLFLDHCDQYLVGTPNTPFTWRRVVFKRAGRGSDPNKGSTKIAHCSGSLISHCVFKDSLSAIALWFDINNGWLNGTQFGTPNPNLVEFCDFRNNPGHALNTEISGPLEVASCRFTNNGNVNQEGAQVEGAALECRASEQLNLHDSVFYNNWKAVGLKASARYRDGVNLNQVRDCTIQNNRIIALAGNHPRQTGLWKGSNLWLISGDSGSGEDDPYNDDNDWIGNDYEFANTLTPAFFWQTNSDKTFSQWQAAGQDTAGSLSTFSTPPPEPDLPGGNGGGEPPPPPPPGGGGPIPAQVRVASRIIVPVTSRF